MYAGNDILQTIIHQSTKGFKAWQIEPMWISIDNNEREINRLEILPEVAPVGSHIYREVTKTINLDNDILILANKELDIPISATLTLESQDNLYTITKAEYAVITFHKYQAFSNYLKVHLKDYGNYVPFQLEFLRIVPTISPGHHKDNQCKPFGNKHQKSAENHSININPDNHDRAE